ncbi:hypothetical protein WJX81_006898 [Elliptochloris bilobata]|uniref:Bifunctional lysine-specific demethylase and histidyl-hydroxylase n=1 Tax=Elliptochloris bilobata TaxID=381761 RepID=A0AAW1RDR0_9CHLO
MAEKKQVDKEVQLLAKIASVLQLPQSHTPTSVLKAALRALKAKHASPSRGTEGREQAPGEDCSRHRKRRRKDVGAQCPEVLSNSDGFHDPHEAFVRGFKPSLEGLEYTLELDVVHYNGLAKQVHNANADGEGGTADADLVWRRFSEAGCSLRLLHPQRWRDELWRTLAPLEAFFGCAAGCNAYLTPGGSQGFAPHYDDIDAFVLQLEGSKRWRVYSPRSAEEVLPRSSSEDFSQQDIGEPVLDEVLEPGNLLYMPRGTIHQAEALLGEHSLHMTISVCQHTSWADFLAVALPRAVDLAAEEVVELRQSLPRDLFSHLGIVHADSELERRSELASTAMRM